MSAPLAPPAVAHRACATRDSAADADGLLPDLMRALSNGGVHRISELEAALGARAVEVRTAVAALASLGVALRSEGSTVRAEPFVALDPQAIARHLAGWNVRTVFSTASTNSDLLREVRRQERYEGPALRAAEVQVDGRGRLGRTWISSPGASLTVSFALRVARPLAGLGGVALTCGLAVHDALATFGIPLSLKWPNDVLADGRKLGGILVEAHPVAGSTLLVIGVGINVAAASTAGTTGSTGLRAASLQAPGEPPIDRNALIARLAIGLEERMATFAVEGFAAFADRWNALDAFRDRPVTLASPPHPDVVGIARGVDRDGALLIDEGGRRRRVIAGDVSLRPLAEPARTERA